MKIKKILKLAGLIIISQMAGVVGSIFTIRAINEWYEYLLKPALNPPNWLFGPVWIILYFIIGISAFIVIEKGTEVKNIKIAMKIFGLQLLFNTSWSIIFFGLKNPGLAFLNIIILFFLIGWMILKFYRISKIAGLILIPYILWVSFASYLNLSIWLLN